MAQQQSDYRFTYVSAAGDFDVIDFQLSEHLSAAFLLHLTLSRKNEEPVDYSVALDNPGTLIFWKGKEKIRYLNGIVTKLKQTEVGARRTSYEVDIRPMFSRAHLRSNVRILQEQTVPDIIKRLLKENGIDKIRFDLSEAHETREYCVQYRETDQRFIERLAAEEGMFYYFEHTLHNHTLVFCDDVLLTTSLGTVLHNPNTSASRTEPSLWNFTYKEKIATAKHKMRDYSFKNPDYDQQHEKMGLNLDNQHKSYEKYDYPGRYKKDAAGKPFNQYRLDHERKETQVAKAISDDLRLINGKMIKLSQKSTAHEKTNWLIVGLSQFGDQPQSLEEDSAGGGGSHYANRPTLIPQGQQWRPTPQNKPRVDGPQMARVTGPKGEEIYCDEHGRVKIQFPWDLEGKYDDLSSCWVRVSQGWAGVSWGSIAIPRIGQEVIVSFLEGDPDQPMITGRSYHDYNKAPYELPANKTRMSIKSKTHKGEGFNELRFEDKTGEEQLFIHAQKDQDTRILNDTREWIGRDRHLIIKNDQFEAVEGNKHSFIKKDQYQQIKGDQHLTIKGSQSDKITSSTSRNISQDLQEKTGMKYAVDAGTEIHLKAGNNAVIDAGSAITLKTGGSFINIDGGGVTMQGATLMINSGGAPVAGSGSNPTAAIVAQLAVEADDATRGWEAKPPPPVTELEAPEIEKDFEIKIEGYPPEITPNIAMGLSASTIVATKTTTFPTLAELMEGFAITLSSTAAAAITGLVALVYSPGLNGDVFNTINEDLRIRSVDDDPPPRFEQRIDGEWVDTGVRANPVYDDNNKIVGFEGLSEEDARKINLPPSHPVMTPVPSGTPSFPAESPERPGRMENPNHGTIGASDTGGQEAIDNGTTILTTPNDGVAGVTVYNTTGARLGERRVSKELYDDLRSNTPNSAIRDKVNKGKIPPYPDEALPGMTVTKRLEADHIVPMDKITRMEGFDKLTKEQQLSVLNNPDNFIGLSKSANTSKGSKSFEEWTEHKKTGTPVDPVFRENMIKVEKELEVSLQQQIDDLAKLNSSN